MQSDSLGRYRIERELGRGSMGRVFLAHDPEIDRKVAIKTINIFAALPQGERRTARERFLTEVRAAGKLLHPGIVAIFDVGEESGVPYLAMEYVEGRPSISSAGTDTLLPVSTVAELVASAAETLAYAHREGIIHRDVKPANILRVGESGTKIMDFGLAKVPAGQPDPGRSVARYAELHGARAGARRLGRRAQRSLLAGDRAVRDADGAEAVLGRNGLIGVVPHRERAARRRLLGRPASPRAPRTVSQEGADQAPRESIPDGRGVRGLGARGGLSGRCGRVLSRGTRHRDGIRAAGGPRARGATAATDAPQEIASPPP